MEPLSGMTGHCCATVSANTLPKIKRENIAMLKSSRSRLPGQPSSLHVLLPSGQIGMYVASSVGTCYIHCQSASARLLRCIVSALQMPLLPGYLW